MALIDDGTYTGRVVQAALGMLKGQPIIEILLSVEAGEPVCLRWVGWLDNDPPRKAGGRSSLAVVVQALTEVLGWDAVADDYNIAHACTAIKGRLAECVVEHRRGQKNDYSFVKYLNVWGRSGLDPAFSEEEAEREGHSLSSWVRDLAHAGFETRRAPPEERDPAKERSRDTGSGASRSAADAGTPDDNMPF